MIQLIDYSTSPDAKYSKHGCRKEMKSLHDKLFELQNVFYADGRLSRLTVKLLRVSTNEKISQPKLL